MATAQRSVVSAEVLRARLLAERTLVLSIKEEVVYHDLASKGRTEDAAKVKDMAGRRFAHEGRLIARMNEGELRGLRSALDRADEQAKALVYRSTEQRLARDVGTVNRTAQPVAVRPLQAAGPER